MDRYWLLTSTFYGNWLPGDPRGFVSRVRDERPDDPTSPRRREHDRPGTPYDQALPGLRRHAATLLKGDPIRVTQDQAELLVVQFRTTAGYRGWDLEAAAVMSNHVHLVVGVPGDPDPGKVLGDFKEYGSRTLNRRYGKRTWWTQMGSKRKLPDDAAVAAAVRYVRKQPGALVVWLAEGRAGDVSRRAADVSRPSWDTHSAD